MLIRFFFIAVLLFPSIAAGDSMKTGRQTSQPIGHYEFCKVLPAECRIRLGRVDPVVLTNEMWSLIVSTNNEVNQDVRPLNDIDIYGKDEVWTYPDIGAGDCEDYALLKRRELKKAGISLANLLITVVRKQDGEGHAVLTVRTDQGDYILDNLEPRTLMWHQTGYRFLKRQASWHTGRWVSLRFPEHDLLATAGTN